MHCLRVLKDGNLCEKLSKVSSLAAEYSRFRETLRRDLFRSALRDRRRSRYMSLGVVPPSAQERSFANGPRLADVGVTMLPVHGVGKTTSDLTSRGFLIVI